MNFPTDIRPKSNPIYRNVNIKTDIGDAPIEQSCSSVHKQRSNYLRMKKIKQMMSLFHPFRINILTALIGIDRGVFPVWAGNYHPYSCETEKSPSYKQWNGAGVCSQLTFRGSKSLIISA